MLHDYTTRHEALEENTSKKINELHHLVEQEVSNLGNQTNRQFSEQTAIRNALIVSDAHNYWCIIYYNPFTCYITLLGILPAICEEGTGDCTAVVEWSLRRKSASTTCPSEPRGETRPDAVVMPRLVDDRPLPHGLLHRPGQQQQTSDRNPLLRHGRQRKCLQQQRIATRLY